MAAVPQTVDARWLMAYAAALGDMAPEYLDTRRPEGILAHPVFPVCYEWVAWLEMLTSTLPPPIAARGVHATQDLILHRRPRAGDRLQTVATALSVKPTRAGVQLLTSIDTVDEAGAPVTTTRSGLVCRDVVGTEETLPSQGDALQGLASRAEGARARWSAAIPIAANLAHVYTECARIWNPIHTDAAYAAAAGLPEIILHGTATLACAVSEVLRRDAAGPGSPVIRVQCRFRNPVSLPCVLTVQGIGERVEPEGHWYGFRVRGDTGATVVEGALALR